MAWELVASRSSEGEMREEDRKACIESRSAAIVTRRCSDERANIAENQLLHTERMNSTIEVEMGQAFLLVFGLSEESGRLLSPDR